MSFYIKNVYVDGKVILAPMAGVTNLAYRKMCREYGASLTVTEMISDKGIFYNDKKTKELAKIDEKEHPVAIQIFGGDIDTMVNAAKWVDCETDADIIDINMGCPVTKVLKSNAGSEYLKDPNRIYKTVNEIVKNVKKPVTVKIRIGYSHDSINVFEVVEKIIKAGASAITIHGRTKTDMYANEVRYDLIKQVKELHPNFPIIANGNITSAKQAKEILEYTKADAIMIGRASYGNPYIFKQINEFLNTNTLLPDLTISQKIQILKKYSQSLVSLKGEFIALKELRGQSGWYIKGCKNSAKIREKLSHINTLNELNDILNSIE